MLPKKKIYIFVARVSEKRNGVTVLLSDGKGAAQAVHAMAMLQFTNKTYLAQTTTLICEVPSHTHLLAIRDYCLDKKISTKLFWENDVDNLAGSDEDYPTALALEPLVDSETVFMQYVPLWASEKS